MSDDVKIDPRPDGPLQVSGSVPLRNSRGETVATESTYWLCRCGGSGKKPFCDGTHKRNGFTSARLSDPADRVTKDYAGKHLTVHDNRAYCAHAGHCTEHSPAVFSQTAEPWIDADGDAQVQNTIASVRMCPSGALAYSIDGVRQSVDARAPAIRITKDGPYAVVGAPRLLGDERPLDTEHFTLCRCGQSKNKPFCDGAHWQAGFKDDKN